MAPEQHDAMAAIREGSPVPTTVDGRADIYSLGLLLYEALGGDAGAGAGGPPAPTAKLGLVVQNSALPGVRAKGITSRMFETPVMNISMRSKPRPKPECGTVP